MFQYGAPADPKLHADSLAEVKRGRQMMGAGAAVALVGLLLPSWWMRLGGIGGGFALWTVGMKGQMTAGVEAKLADEGVPAMMGRCMAQCAMGILPPL